MNRALPVVRAPEAWSSLDQHREPGAVLLAVQRGGTVAGDGPGFGKRDRCRALCCIPLVSRVSIRHDRFSPCGHAPRRLLWERVRDRWDSLHLALGQAPALLAHYTRSSGGRRRSRITIHRILSHGVGALGSNFHPGFRPTWTQPSSRRRAISSNTCRSNRERLNQPTISAARVVQRTWTRQPKRSPMLRYVDGETYGLVRQVS